MVYSFERMYSCIQYLSVVGTSGLQRLPQADGGVSSRHQYSLGDQSSVTSLGDQPSWDIIDVGLPSPVLRAREDVLKFSMVDNL